MATQEKLRKSLEALRNLAKTNKLIPDVAKKKEKIQHCYTITEAISNPTIRISTDFHGLLANSVEIFLRLCEDIDSDVRMTSEECLNRIIRAANDGYIGKIQIELHKEIKRNGSARSLRTALLLFSILARHIRPHKGKPYVANLFPSLIRITQRSEESIHETLAISLPKIMDVLGCFSTENEVKSLLKAFLINVTGQSAVIRRTTSSCILNICMNCRKPYIFIMYCLNHLLDLLIPVNESHPTHLILGVMLCTKVLLPNLKSSLVKQDYSENNWKIEESITEKYLQVFELCLYYLTNKDHNIVNVCLETLNILLQNCTDNVKNILLSENGIDHCRIHSVHSSTKSNPRSPSQLSVATNLTAGEENLFSESELTDTIRSDIEKWIDTSKLSVMNITFAKTKEKSLSLDKMNTCVAEDDTSNICSFESAIETDHYDSKMKTHSVGDNLDRLTASENSSEKSLSYAEEKILNIEYDIQEIDIGDYLDKTPPLLYCARLITKLFLLSGTPQIVISDRQVRVSVKSLALSCLSSAFLIYPYGFLVYLDKNYEYSKLSNKKICSQQISDILLFKSHSDPQLRGIVRTLVSNFIKAVLILSEDNYDKWISDNAGTGHANCLDMPQLIQIFLEGLEDESANCIRQTLLSLNTVLNTLWESQNSILTLPLLSTLPILAKNPYWLVKVALCELVSKINYVTVNYITETSDFQSKIIYNVLFELLGDNDKRVRTSAATSIVQIIPVLYFEDYRIRENAVTSKAILEENKIVKSISNSKAEMMTNKRHFIMNMPFPFNKLEVDGCDKIDFSLSKLVLKLYNIVLTATSKYLISGCIETLSMLSDAYPCTIYKSSWCSSVSIESSTVPDLFSLCISLLSTSIHVYDLQCHINILNLSTNLYAGQSIIVLKPVVDSDGKLWDMFPNDTFPRISEQFLSHVVKVLNIFHHVLNEFNPVFPQSKTVLPNLPTTTNLSPLKRRKSDLDKKTLLSVKLEKEEKVEKKESSKSNMISSFVSSPHYMKIFDLLKSSFLNYKVSLESEGSQNFLELLNKILKSLSVMMEVGTLVEFSRIAEDVLIHLGSTFSVDASSTVECVQQLLKCLFSTNLTSNITEFTKENKPKEKTDEENYGFYYNIFQKPYSDISIFINSLNNISRYYCDGDSTVMGYLHRKDVKKRSMVLSRSSDKVLANYIRIFEPMVIKSLKRYTITSDIKLQCRVLQLLNQLVQLRVNYCLLDSEQVFIGFVLKQFEYIEEGQVPLPEVLIPKIFQFLVQLSYSKQHSKCIIDVPKIIQLCDGLMASGQPPLTHCIPALEPIVEDIFLTRNKSNTSDMKELETTREVLLSMLLRLSEYKEVMSLLTLILEDSRYCADNTEKWLDWSKQVLSVVLPMLKQNKIRLDDFESFVEMRRFILALEPNVFKPFDEIIIMFFQEPPMLEQNETPFIRWLSKILIMLLILIPLKEDTLLGKINKLKSEFSPNCIFENAVTKADPLNVNNNADTFGKIPAELIFIRFIFRIASLTSKHCLTSIKNKENVFLIEQFSSFLMHCLYIFQSGSHCKITNKCITILNKNIPFDENDVIQIEEINKNFLSLAAFYPILTFHWCYFLMLTNYNDRWFWTQVLKINNKTENRLKNSSINLEITKMGGAISFCDYLNEDLVESENVIWFLTNISQFLVALSNEAPVLEFISSIHRNSNLSKIFIENVSRNCSTIDCVVFKTKLLKCIENCHSSQIGPVLNLVIPNMLNYRQVALSRLAANLASRKIEFLLTLPMEEVHNQLSKEDIVKMQKVLVSLHLIKKHETLVSLLNKLSTQYYDLSPLEFAQRRIVNPEYIKRLKINKKWYLSQIQGRYSETNVGKETAELLSHLEYNEIISFMSSSEFNKLCLQNCIKFGLLCFKQHSIKEEPAILRACADCLLKHITSLVAKVPVPHQVFNPLDRNPTLLETKYLNEMRCIFRQDDFSHLLCSIAACIPYYLDSLSCCPKLKISADSNYQEIMHFGVICLELINDLLSENKKEFNVDMVDVFLIAADRILKNSSISNLLGQECNITWFCSSVTSIYNLVKILLENDKPLPSLPKECLKKSLEHDETLAAGQVTYQLYTLVSWMFETRTTDVNIPVFLLKSINSVIVSLSRSPVVNSFILVPSRVLATGRVPEISGTFHTQVPPLPIELLQEIEILQEYIFRITLLGWTSRQQFEETWMCLLSVLCAPLDELDPLEINDMVHVSSLAIKAITSLLLETLKYPAAGHPNISNFVHLSRDAPIADENISVKKLKRVQEKIIFKHSEFENTYKNSEVLNVFESRNFEKLSNKYSYGQISIEYFLLAVGITQGSDDGSVCATVFKKRNKLLEDAGLDINSCLQFLLDYYTQLMKPQSLTNIRILHEAVRSTVIISDLFTDKSQFTWLLNEFLELSKLHAVEDELLHQYLIVGICKAAGVLTPDLETYEQIKKMLVQYLKSPYLSSRIASLHGLLYILEGCKLSNITIGGISEEMQLILPCAVEYVQFNLSTNNSVLQKSQEHSLLLWSLAFYLIENIEESHMEQNFVSNTLTAAFNILNSKSTTALHYSIVKGLERLLILKKSQIYQKYGKQILKLALDRMKHNSPTVALTGTQLLLSYMYTDCSDHLQNTQTPANMQTSPDHLVQTIEKISAIFERVKKGYVFEVDILCSVISIILDDFFSPSDILTKVIGEFLSPQQPHPELMSKVVFQVFETAIRREQLPLLQDWVVFSLSNFTQSFSIGMATWCLTCFFISASSNEWLRSYFPYVQTRVGRYEYEDKKLLCIAGADFYNNLPNEAQKQKFVDNFRKVKDQPDTPFDDLLSSL